MTTIRIGNDVHVRWSVFSRNGAPYILDGATIRLWLLSGPFRKRITDFSIAENVVSFLVDAKDLHRYGIYKLVLSLTDSASQTEDTAFDFTEVFQIVSKTYSGSTDAVLDGNVVVTPSSIIDNVVENYVTNAADGEDLTTVNNLLKFRDRPAGDGAKGYVILRQNKTIAEQVTEEDTTYEIRYEFDLDGESVTIPSGCVLKFNGGSIVNGTIVGDNTVIDSSAVKIFNHTTLLSGTWGVAEAYPEWFGAVGDGETDDTISFNDALMAGLGYYVATGIYHITDTITIKNQDVLDGRGSGKILFDTMQEDLPCIIPGVERIHMSDFTTLKNINIESVNKGKGYGVVCYKHSKVENCDITGFNYGIAIKSYVVYCTGNSVTKNTVNVGIASEKLDETQSDKWILQVNAVTIRNCNIGNPTSGYNIAIGKVTGLNPWAATSGTYGYGHLNLIEDCCLDPGQVLLENIEDVTIRHCYFEDGLYGDSERGDLPEYHIGIRLGDNVRKISVEDNFFHMLDYGVKADICNTWQSAIFINNNFFGTLKKTCAYFYRTPSDLSYKYNYGWATDYLQAHFGLYELDKNDVNSRLLTIRKNTDLLPALTTAVIKGEAFGIVGDYNGSINVSCDDYLTRSSESSFSGTYTNTGEFTLASASSLKSLYPGSKIKNHDCFISYIDIENRKVILYSPTSDYPNTSENTLTWQATTAYTGVQRVSKGYSDWESLQIPSGELSINSYLSKAEIKSSSRRYDIPILSKGVARCVGVSDELSLQDTKVLVINNDILISGTVDVTPNAVIYFAGGSIGGSGTLNFTNNLILGAKSISDVVINSNVTVTGSYYMNNKPASGATSARPSNAPAGYVYFDASLGTYGKPIWSDGDGHWVDATGTSV